jgi:hypothetical protein
MLRGLCRHRTQEAWGKKVDTKAGRRQYIIENKSNVAAGPISRILSGAISCPQLRKDVDAGALGHTSCAPLLEMSTI